MFKELNIMNVFFENPTKEFNVREISRILKIAPATASSYLKKLEKKGILKERKERIFNLYSSNLDSETYLDFKKFYNIHKIRESGLIESLNKFYFKPIIVLFGSASNGLDTEDSDIDLLVISEKTKDFQDIKKFEKKLNRKIQLFVFEDIHKIKNPHLVNNILNGINLQGEIKWI